MTENVHEIQAAQYEAEVLGAPEPVVLDFFSTECPPCEALAPKFEAVADQFNGRVRFLVMWSHEPRAFLGETTLQKLRVENLKTKQTSRVGSPPAPPAADHRGKMWEPSEGSHIIDLDTDGVFVFVGMVPRTELLMGLVPLDRWGCVETDDSMQTSVPGLFVAGDIRAKKFRQITTAVADGTIAALAAQRYLREAH